MRMPIASGPGRQGPRYVNVNISPSSFKDGSEGDLSTDTNGNEYKWQSGEWVKIGSGGAVHVSTQASSVWAYGTYPEYNTKDSGEITTTGAGVVATFSGLDIYNMMTLHIIARAGNTLRVEGSLDNTNWESILLTDYVTQAATVENINALGVFYATPILFPYIRFNQVNTGAQTFRAYWGRN